MTVLLPSQCAANSQDIQQTVSSASSCTACHKHSHLARSYHSGH